MAPTRHICMIAAENDVIPGAKVGGIGDVVRDIPKALADTNTFISVIIPAYGAFHELPDANLITVYSTRFRGSVQRIELYEVAAGRDANVQYLVLHHPLFSAGGKGVVYCDDDATQPFATDANKYALFSVAALDAIISESIDAVDVLHLHDWHAALALPLIHFDDTFESLRDIRTVFSIHNLALQGIRPFAENSSSLQAWFPHLHYDPHVLADPRWPHCVNPVVAAINLANKVHTVSPTYAQEILLANDPAKGFHGGEGLELALSKAANAGKLVGIVNGIEYPTEKLLTVEPDESLSWSAVAQQLSDEMLEAMARSNSLRALDYITHQRMLSAVSKQRPEHIVTSVGRLTDQKMAILLHPIEDEKTALDAILLSLANRGILILMGSGDEKLELQCQKIAGKYNHCLFVNHYSAPLSELLFANGDIFLMPSSFEPCGISQMIAMKHGQPCIAHAVGGLSDTIQDDVDGFLFKSDSLTGQAMTLIQRVNDVLSLREDKPASFKRIANAARKKRFNWGDSASRYKTELYS